MQYSLSAPLFDPANDAMRDWRVKEAALMASMMSGWEKVMSDNLDMPIETDEEPNDVFQDVMGVQEVVPGFKMIDDTPKRATQDDSFVDESSENIRKGLTHILNTMGVEFLQAALQMHIISEQKGFKFDAPDAFDLNYYDDQFQHWFLMYYPDFGRDFHRMSDQDQAGFKLENYRAKTLIDKYPNPNDATEAAEDF